MSNKVILVGIDGLRYRTAILHCVCDAAFHAIDHPEPGISESAVVHRAVAPMVLKLKTLPMPPGMRAALLL